MFGLESDEKVQTRLICLFMIETLFLSFDGWSAATWGYTRRQMEPASSCAEMSH
jgi:hypothetical protein